MTKEERARKNIAIAEALGFEKYVSRTNGRPNDYVHWSYPKEWRHLQASHPVSHVPDFIGMIELVVDVGRVVGPCGKTDFGTWVSKYNLPDLFPEAA